MVLPHRSFTAYMVLFVVSYLSLLTYIELVIPSKLSLVLSKGLSKRPAYIIYFLLSTFVKEGDSEQLFL